MSINNITNATTSAPLPGSSSPVGKPGASGSGNDVANATNSTTNSTTNNAANAGGASSAASATAAGSGSSSVTTISSISTQLAAAQAAASSDSVFSSTKVNEIKQAISEGRFSVNASNVANGLLESVDYLLNSRRQ